MEPTIWLSFLAGFLSFISPCVLPLYPSYISYISGVSFAHTINSTHRTDQRWKAISHTFFFVLGFSLIFFVLGLSATLVGRIFAQYRDVIRVIGGIVVAVMGTFVSGLVTPSIFLREKKWHYHKNRISYIGSLLVGISFAAGWTPCIGPILSSVLVLTTSHANTGIALILAYIIGFSVPFFILSGTLSSVRRITRYGAIISRVSGYVMIIMGILLATNSISKITVLLVRLSGGFMGF